MASRQDILAFYSAPTGMTAPGCHAAGFDGLPGSAAALAKIVQGLYIHEFIAGAYGVTFPEERRAEVHLRSTEARLGRLLAADGKPLTEARTADQRMIANCRHYSVLFAAMLRSQGRPARARCGFGTYFEPGKFIDHWICECWEAGQARWVQVDAQLDDLQRSLFRLDFDPLDVPRDRFLTAGVAWKRYREGAADPERFGILDMNGWWFIAGNLLRDAASLNNAEMLPWDVWGAMPTPDTPIDEGQNAFFDRLAALTEDPDASFDELRALYDCDERLRVPQTVFNAVLNRPEPV